jgi:hypothetical protein
MDGAIVGAFSLTVQADGDNTADADTFVAGVGAISISGSSAKADITDAADVETTLASTGSIHATNFVLVTALSDNQANADADAGTGGALAFGESSPTATISGGTKVEFGADINSASSLTITSTSDNDATAKSVVVSIGMFAGGGANASAQIFDAADTDAIVTSAALLTIPGAAISISAISDNHVIASSGGVDVGAVSVSTSSPFAKTFADTTAQLLGSVGTTTPGVDADGNPTTYGVAGASSVTVTADATDTSRRSWIRQVAASSPAVLRLPTAETQATVKAEFGSGNITASGDVTLLADSTTDSDALADSMSGGLIQVAGLTTNAKSDPQSRRSSARGSSRPGDDLSIRAVHQG